MGFDITAAAARLANSTLVSPRNAMYAPEQAVLQFNALLVAASREYPSSIDIGALRTFATTTIVDPAELRDALDRLREGLAAVQTPTAGDSPMLSQKFGILRAEPQLPHDFEQYLADSGGLGLIFFDIDDFKRLNTQYTETAVDLAILAPLMRLIEESVVSRGFAYSVGGDEFIILLRNSSLDESVAFAERLASNVRSRTFEVSKDDVTITLSLGVANYPTHGQELESLRLAANAAERTSKNQGKNCVSVPGSA